MYVTGEGPGSFWPAQEGLPSPSSSQPGPGEWRLACCAAVPPALPIYSLLTGMAVCTIASADFLLWCGCLSSPPPILNDPEVMFFSPCCFRSPEIMSTVSGTRSTTVTFTVRPGTSQPITLQSRPPDYESRTSGPRRAPSPVVSPTELNKEILPTPLSAAAASPSPTLSDVFSLPSQSPAGDLFGLNPAGRSRSPSPSILQQPISNKPFTTKPVHLWTKPDVADWLESLNLGEHKETFMDNEIDGSHLPNLQKEDLIDLGVTRVGHRMNIERALKQLLDR